MRIGRIILICVGNHEVYIAFVVLTFVINIIVLVGNTYLISFHLFIRCKGMSTFDFVIIRRGNQGSLETDKGEGLKTPSEDSFSFENKNVVSDKNKLGPKNEVAEFTDRKN